MNMSNFVSDIETTDQMENEFIVLNHVSKEVPHSLLATLQVRVRDGRGMLVPIRMMADTGAQVNLLSDDAFRRLRLNRQANRIGVVGVGGASVVTMGKISLQLWHHTHERLIDIATFTIIEGMNAIHPYQSFPPIDFKHIVGHELADPNFNECAPVDGIIGVNVLSRRLREQMRKAPHDFLTQESSFGWIVFGGREPEESDDMLIHANVTTTNDLYSMVRRLWEVEEMPDVPIKSKEEIECEQLYENTFERNNGRFSVTLLLQPDAELGESRAQALRRWHSVERRLRQNPDIYAKYIQFMDEYERLGHMQKAEPLDPTAMHYYIPHHAVSIDKKFRVVFDASAKTSNGKSLNDIQYAGPTIQRPLADILMSFRTRKIAMSADIAKMFRQIEVQRKYWDLQRILYRKSTSEPITEYWLTVVTYGMKSSPYNAIRTLNQCACDHSQQYAQAAKIVLSDFYVDDLLTSMDTEIEAIQMKQQLILLLKLGGCQWDKMEIKF